MNNRKKPPFDLFHTAGPTVCTADRLTVIVAFTGRDKESIIGKTWDSETRILLRVQTLCCLLPEDKKV